MTEQEILDRAKRAAMGVDGPDQPYDALLRRRDRKRRNQRIAAGVVGIAVFVAAIWVVTTGGAFDRATPAVPGSQTGPTQIAPPPARAQAGPDVHNQVLCRHATVAAMARLELTDTGDRIKVRFEVHRSPVGHSWRIVLRHHRYRGCCDPRQGQVFFLGFRVSSENGDLAVERSVVDHESVGDMVGAKARDRQTGQYCALFAGIE
jgi:hypothetical protein